MVFWTGELKQLDKLYESFNRQPVAGIKMQETSDWFWQKADSIDATNESEFSALPAVTEQFMGSSGV